MEEYRDDHRGLNSGVLPNLDLLRSVAVVLVLANHVLAAYDAFIARDFRPYEWHLGRVGVLFFFVHTACVLCASLERTVGEGAAWVRTFYLRRVLRIYPLAIVCMAIIAGFSVPRAPWGVYEPAGVAAWISNLTLTMPILGFEPVLGPLWTLPVELQIYVVLPFVFLLTGRARDPARIGIFLVLSLIAAWTLPAITNRFYGVSFAPCFVAGIGAYFLFGRISPRLPAGWLPPFLTAALLAYVAIEERLPGMHHVWLQSAICLGVGVALPFFRQSTSAGLNCVTHLLARYSYGIYLFHCIALWIGVFWHRSQGFSTGVAIAIALAVLVTMAFAGYHLVEAPAIRWARRKQAASGNSVGLRLD